MTGKTIGKYRILSQLGRGGMGTVYKAVDETLEREVAVKVLNPDLTEGDVMKRFMAEATTLAKLNHPDIATIHEIHRGDEDVLMVMELVRGETLDQLTARCGPLPPERAAYLVAQVLGALEHAHRAGVIHRDLKPANVMVTEQGGVKIMDFGIARVIGAQHMTADGLMVGTPAYMAPERVVEKDVDARSDLYSAGVLFYRLLTGKLPFQADTAIGMVQKLMTEAPTPAHVYRADVPSWCETILDKALAKSPADRFQTAESFRGALLAAISGATEQTGVYATQALTKAVPSAAASAPTGSVPAASVPLVSVPAIAPVSGVVVAPPQIPTPSAPQPLATPAPAVAASAQASSPSTVVLKRKQLAVGGLLLGALAIAAVILAVVALKRPSTETAATPADTAATAPDGQPEASSAPAPALPPLPPPTAIAEPPLAVPAAPQATASAAPLPAAKTVPSAVAPGAAVAGRLPAVTTPFTFEAKAVVVDGDKHREKDATVVVANGSVTVTEKGAKVLFEIPITSITNITYSNSKQPLWNSPTGPAEAMKVEGGALGFLRGGRNWFGLRTRDSLLMLRVDDDAIRRVTMGLEERTGLRTERLVEPKG